MKHVVIYSHGFGVDRTDRGLFTDIADYMPGSEHVMFDYNDVDPDTGDMTVSSFSDQVTALQNVVGKIVASEDTVVDLVAHSQGCIIAALAGCVGLRNIVFIAPPSHLDSGSMISYFGSKKGAVVDVDADSTVPRRDGSVTTIPASYWADIDNLDLIGLYSSITAQKMNIYRASDDEVIGITDFTGLPSGVEIETLDGDHDFTGEYRAALVVRAIKDLQQ